MTKKNKQEPIIVVGDDGLPEPVIQKGHEVRKFECSCPICHYNECKLQLTAKGTYLVKCSECKIILYLNSDISITLFRGYQNLFANEPEVQENLINAVVDYAPDNTTVPLKNP
jgi:hypothetical protein